MKCNEIKESGLLIDMAEGLLDPKHAGFIDAHLPECAICLAELSEMRLLLTELKSAPDTVSTGRSDSAEPPMPTPEAFDIMERAVRQELKISTGRVVSLPPKHRASTFRRYASTIIPVAAVLLLFVGTSVWNDAKKENHIAELADVATVPESKSMERQFEATEKLAAKAKTTSPLPSVQEDRVEVSIDSSFKEEAGKEEAEPVSVGRQVAKPLKIKSVKKRATLEEAVPSAPTLNTATAPEGEAVGLHGYSPVMEVDAVLEQKRESLVKADYVDAIEGDVAFEETIYYGAYGEVSVYTEIHYFMEEGGGNADDAWSAIEDARRGWFKDELALSDIKVGKVVSILGEYDMDTRPIYLARLFLVRKVIGIPKASPDYMERREAAIDGLLENREAIVAIYETRNRAVAAVLSKEEMVRYRELYRVLEGKYRQLLEEVKQGR